MKGHLKAGTHDTIFIIRLVL